MAMHHASPEEVFDLAPLGPKLKDARTTAVVKSEAFEVVLLIVHADTDIKAHIDGPITLHCPEGRALLRLPKTSLELSAGQWMYLEGGVPHSLKGIEDTSLLLTILFLSASAAIFDNEVAYNKAADALETFLISSARNAELKSLPQTG